MLKRIVLVGFILSLGACASFNTGKLNIQGKERIKNKASFFFQCENVSMVCINSDVNVNDLCSEYGVTACGNKAIYTKIGKSWIMTSSKPL